MAMPNVVLNIKEVGEVFRATYAALSREMPHEEYHGLAQCDVIKTVEIELQRFIENFLRQHVANLPKPAAQVATQPSNVIIPPWMRPRTTKAA